LTSRAFEIRCELRVGPGGTDAAAAVADSWPGRNCLTPWN